MKRCKRVHPLAKWRFYYEEHGEEIQLAVYDCRVPSRTKYWKKLQGLYAKPGHNVNRIGYEIVPAQNN